jgi:2-polyprenyl-6-methoxyphenol hydroxylase-like FAD-dependent oxidoreductase
MASRKHLEIITVSTYILTFYQLRINNVEKVGGSLAGLMTSIALRRLGHNVRILERAPTPLLHDQGAGIVFGGDTQEFMSRYEKSGREIAVTSKQRLYLNKGGQDIQEEDKAQRMTSWDLLYNLCRANFDGIYDEEYLQDKRISKEQGEGSASYEHGKLVTDLEDRDNHVSVHFNSTLPDSDCKSKNSNEPQIYTADLVIIAEGASSNLRHKLWPQSPSRTYAGYVAFRGTVPETELSATSRTVFIEKFPFFHGPHTQILAYVIPGRAGTVTPGERLVNWVWYVNVAGDSDEYKEIMTDRDGVTHRWTLPTGGKMRESVWEARKKDAQERLPPQFVELVEKTKTPFVQAITDLEPPSNGKVWGMDGKVVLVGDALAGFRPHTAASTSQAALHAVMLGRVYSGEMGKEEYERKVMGFANSMQKHGVVLGERSQFGRHPLQS